MAVVLQTNTENLALALKPFDRDASDNLWQAAKLIEKAVRAIMPSTKAEEQQTLVPPGWEPVNTPSMGGTGAQ